MKNKLKIAMLAPIWERIPPRKYGGAELVVYNITEELIRRGHQVTLFATKNSKTSAKLDYVFKEPLYRNGVPWDNFLYPLLHISNCFDKRKGFDIIHTHLNTRVDYPSLVLANYINIPSVTTIHCKLLFTEKEKDREQLLTKYKNNNFISISYSQRKNFKNLNYIANVYNGIDVNSYKFDNNPKDYLIWLGRICYEKGLFEAIQAAKKAKKKLYIIAKIDLFNREYREYYEKKIKPLINNKDIIYAGEVGFKDKSRLLRDAKALLAPLNWDEPFGLFMTEALSCGTPVIAFNRGSVSEIVLNKKNGFVVKDVAGMVKAINNIDSIKRSFCRESVENKFDIKSMVDGYEETYLKVLMKQKKDVLCGTKHY